MLAVPLEVAVADAELTSGAAETGRARAHAAREKLDVLTKDLAKLSPEGRAPSVVVRLALAMAEQTLGALLPPPGVLAMCEPERRIRLPDGGIADFSDKPLMWRLAAALAAQHAASPGTPIDREKLVLDVWPGEKIAAKAAQNRLSVALHKLRSEGFDGIVQTTPAGTAMSPAVRLVRSRRLLG